MIRGQLHPDFWPVARALQRQLRTPRQGTPRQGGPPQGAPRQGGAAVCVYHRGEKVVDIWGGSKDAGGTPWEADTMALSFSTTKGVVSTALHMLVDQGRLDYDDPVARHWPEFAQNGKDRITVRQLLCHEAGLYGLRNRIDHASRMLDWEYMTDVLARSVPQHQPGSANGYHALSYGWLVGELIQRVSGKPLPNVLCTEIAEPLQLDGLFIGVPRQQQARVAELIRSKHMTRSPDSLRPFARGLQRVFSSLRLPIDIRRMADALLPTGIEELDWSSPEVLSVPIPAANGVFTARSLAKLYATLAAGGTLDGVRLLSEETLRRATEIQNRRLDLVVPFPMHWRLGYHRVGTTRGTPRRGFGHYGFGGSGAWADPDRQLAVAMVLNSGMGTPFGDLRIVRISGAALGCANRR